MLRRRSDEDRSAERDRRWGAPGRARPRRRRIAEQERAASTSLVESRRRRGGRPSRLPVRRRPAPRSSRPTSPGAPTSSSASPSRAPRRSAACGSGQVLIGHLAPWTAAETNKALAAAGVTSFAMEAIPRTTRAQAMDALSSQAAAAGYAAMLIAARESGRFFGMMTTAAGTVPPAKVLVLGAGVAGLQAVATAKRLGRDRHRLRHPPRRLGADRLARRPAAGTRLHPRRRGRGRLRAAADRRGERAGARRDRRERRQAGHHRHHRRDPRPSGAAPDHRRRGARHGARLGDRRPRRRDRRQLRADRGRRDRRSRAASR